MIRRVVAWVLLAGPAAADDGPRLRLESAVGMDSNITRSEGANRISDSVARAVLDAEDGLALAGVHLRVNYQLGARHFLAHPEEDGVFQVLGAQLNVRATDWLGVGADVRLQDRTTRDPVQPRDYTRVAAGPVLSLRLGRLRVSASARASRLAFKPDDRFSADGLGTSVGAVLPLGAWRLRANAGVSRRRFEGPRLDQTGTTSEGPVVVPVDDERRADETRMVGAGVRYAGGALAQLDYSLATNDSNSFRAGFLRHLVRASTTFSLPLELLASVQVDLQRVIYDDPQFISLETFVEDENRSSVKLRVERPFAERWSAVAQFGVWFSPFGSGTDYARRTALLGLACHLGG